MKTIFVYQQQFTCKDMKNFFNCHAKQNFFCNFVVMRIIRHIIYTAATLLLTASCGDKTTISTDDFTEKIFTPQHASGFEIRGDGEGNTLLGPSRSYSYCGRATHKPPRSTTVRQ